MAIKNLFANFLQGKSWMWSTKDMKKHEGHREMLATFSIKRFAFRLV